MGSSFSKNISSPVVAHASSSPSEEALKKGSDVQMKNINLSNETLLSSSSSSSSSSSTLSLSTTEGKNDEGRERRGGFGGDLGTRGGGTTTTTTKGEEGCPYKSSSNDPKVKESNSAPWWAFGCPKREGEVGTKYRKKDDKAEEGTGVVAKETSSRGGVGIDNGKGVGDGGASMRGYDEVGGCPIKGEKTNFQYDVYSRPIDPSNQMPISSVTNQLPSPQQTIPLSTDRVSSTIPKGGLAGSSKVTWTYPSPQMFYNALYRKGKTGATTSDGAAAFRAEEEEEEQRMMETVVALHNNMNESTWAKILEWEELIGNSVKSAVTGGSERKLNSNNDGPTLLRFCGRPSDLSPKAYIKHYLFNHPLPFDRHDWMVLRSDGTEIRYVIDYYHDESSNATSHDSNLNFVALDQHGVVKSILVDVRPALDNFDSLYRRMVAMPLARRGMFSNNKPKNTFDPLPLMPTDDLKNQTPQSVKLWDQIQERGKHLLKSSSSEESNVTVRQKLEDEEEQVVVEVPPPITREEAIKHAKNFAKVLKECRDAQKAVDEAAALLSSNDNENENDDPSYTRATLQLTLCMAKILCPLQHSAVQHSLQLEENNSSSDDNDDEYEARIEVAIENAALCVANANERIVSAKRENPSVFQNLSVGRQTRNVSGKGE